MPAARRESAEDRLLRRRLVEMEWLRIEFGGKGFDPVRLDAHCPGAKGLAHAEIVEVALGHLGVLPYERATRSGAAGRSNHAPPATAAALISPKAAIAAPSAKKT